MVRKFAICAAVAAAMFISPSAFAGHGKGHGHHHGHGLGHHHRHGNLYRNDWDHGRVNWNAPLRGRWWGGRWWGYGEGACWRWTPGGYVWICR